MFEQFFQRPFFVTLAALAGTFALAAIAFPFPALSAVVLAAVMAVTAVAFWKRPEYGMAIAFAELFANSHGHLVSYELGGFSFSLRMAIFVAVMGAWVVSLLAGRLRLPLRDPRLIPFLPLAAAVTVGFAVGFARNDPATAFADGNAYLYLAYLLPILSIEWDVSKKRLLLQVFAASAIWVSILTLGLLYVFTHFPEWVLGPVYSFVRDTRTGELTKMYGNIFRIFLQAQFSVVAMAFFLAPFLFVSALTRRSARTLVGLYAVLASVILISLSRSFWVGIIAGGVVLLGLVAYDARPRARDMAYAAGRLTLAAALGAVLLVGIVLFPFPYRVGHVGDLAGLFSKRTTDASDVAISSRWNLLPPLMEEIESSPLLGSGFGENVTFKTDDPRARAINPDGTWTTYALEWGWLELWLKMGMLGPASFLVLFVFLVRGLVPYVRHEQSWVGVAFISSLVMLYATHVFSPYLNHPLGLGLLLLMVPFLKQKPPVLTRKVLVAAKEERVIPSAVQASVAPITSE